MVDFDYSLYAEKSRTHASCNFDLDEHVRKFDLFEFCYDKSGTDRYGFLVVMNDRYLMGYNASYGLGTHIGAFARVMQNQNGGGIILNDQEAYSLSEMCSSKFIVSSIMHEYVGDMLIKENKYKNYMSFEFKNNSYNSEVINTFKKFYDENNSNIIYLANKFDFKVIFCYKRNEKLLFDKSSNLDNVYEFVTNMKNFNTRKRVNNGH